MANWKELLLEEIEKRGENFETIKTTLTQEDLAKEFNDGYGGSEGCSFTAWGDKYVYFPIVYDGAEWVGSAPRFVSDEKTTHMGGQ